MRVSSWVIFYAEVSLSNPNLLMTTCMYTYVPTGIERYSIVVVMVVHLTRVEFPGRAQHSSLSSSPSRLQ